MSAVAICTVFTASLLLSAADAAAPADQDAQKREELFQRLQSDYESMMAELRRLTPDEGGIGDGSAEEKAQVTEFMRNVLRTGFEVDYIHWSFGLWWDEIPPPDVHGPEALKGVERFVSDHGWNAGTNGLPALYYTKRFGAPISGLPWTVIKDREFPATTLGGVLYVPLRYGAVFNGFACSGVAYNPTTNEMTEARELKHIGDHWYVWRTGSPPKVRRFTKEMVKTANQTVQRTGASRFVLRQTQRHRRLAPVADLYVRRRRTYERPRQSQGADAGKN